MHKQIKPQKTPKHIKNTEEYRHDKTDEYVWFQNSEQENLVIFSLIYINLKLKENLRLRNDKIKHI